MADEQEEVIVECSHPFEIEKIEKLIEQKTL